MDNQYFTLEYLERFLIPLAVAIGVYLCLWLIKNIILRKVKGISIGTDTIIDDVVFSTLDQTKSFFMIGLSILAGLQFLHLPKSYNAWAIKTFIVLLAFQIIIWGKESITSWSEYTILKKHNDPSVRTSLNFISFLLKILFIVLVSLLALDNLGADVTTFIAGLGVGGIAIALATQNILGDLFSSLSIVMDKPFVIGDFIVTGEWMGTIDHIGLKTTRIKSLGGEQIIISNSDLVSSRVRNYKRMRERRVVFQLGVTYQTRREDLMRAPDILRSVIEGQSMARFDRAHFFRYGASSLDFEIVYWVLNPDYNAYADVHQEVLFKIHEAFAANDLDFAYPTQTLHIDTIALPSGKKEEEGSGSPKLA